MAVGPPAACSAAASYRDRQSARPPQASLVRLTSLRPPQQAPVTWTTRVAGPACHAASRCLGWLASPPADLRAAARRKAADTPEQAIPSVLIHAAPLPVVFSTTVHVGRAGPPAAQNAASRCRIAFARLLSTLLQGDCAGQTLACQPGSSCSTWGVEDLMPGRCMPGDSRLLRRVRSPTSDGAGSMPEAAAVEGTQAPT